MKKLIKVTEDYCRYPGGRFPQDEEGIATDFRKMLVPPLRENKPVVVDLDHTTSYASSLFDEAFGRLVSREGFSAGEVLGLLKIQATQPHLINLIGLIERFIKRAKPDNANEKRCIEMEKNGD